MDQLSYVIYIKAKGIVLSFKEDTGGLGKTEEKAGLLGKTEKAGHMP